MNPSRTQNEITRTTNLSSASLRPRTSYQTDYKHSFILARFIREVLSTLEAQQPSKENRNEHMRTRETPQCFEYFRRARRRGVGSEDGVGGWDGGQIFTEGLASEGGKRGWLTNR